MVMSTSALIGFCPIAVSRWRNAHKPAGALGPVGAVMPERVITKPPTAELKPNQTDQDTLPPYDVLDTILACLVEGELSVDEIEARGFARDEPAGVTVGAVDQERHGRT